MWPLINLHNIGPRRQKFENRTQLFKIGTQWTPTTIFNLKCECQSARHSPASMAATASSPRVCPIISVARHSSHWPLRRADHAYIHAGRDAYRSQAPYSLKGSASIIVYLWTSHKTLCTLQVLYCSVLGFLRSFSRSWIKLVVRNGSLRWRLSLVSALYDSMYLRHNIPELSIVCLIFFFNRSYAT